MPASPEKLEVDEAEDAEEFMMGCLVRAMKRLFFALVFFAVGVGLCAIAISPQQAVETIQVVTSPKKVAFGEKSFLYILLCGLDYSYDSNAQRHTKDARTDTIMLIRVEPRAKDLSILSIPRDLLVPIAGTGGAYDKVNAAYSSGGIATTRQTIEAFLKIKIDHTVTVKSDVVADLVDELGGVPITVEKQMDYDDNWAKLHIHLKPGEQVLNGEQTVGYLRFRNDEEGDFGRIRRQQQFLTALIRELKSVKHLPKYKALAEAVDKKMDTDLSIEQMAALANLYRNFPLPNISKGRVEVADYFENGISYLIPIEGEPASTMRELFTPLPDARLADIPVVIEDYRTGERRKLTAGQRFTRAGFGQVSILAPGRQGKSVEQTSLLITGQSEAVEKVLPKLFPGVLIFKKKSDDAPHVTLRLRAESDLR